MNVHRERVVLPRSGPNHFWVHLRGQYEDDAQAWRRLMMLALREGLEWPLQWIADGFDIHEGTASRNIQQAKEDLRAALDDGGWEYP